VKAEVKTSASCLQLTTLCSAKRIALQDGDRDYREKMPANSAHPRPELQKAGQSATRSNFGSLSWIMKRRDAARPGLPSIPALAGHLSIALTV